MAKRKLKKEPQQSSSSSSSESSSSSSEEERPKKMQKKQKINFDFSTLDTVFKKQKLKAHHAIKFTPAVSRFLGTADNEIFQGPTTDRSRSRTRSRSREHYRERIRKPLSVYDREFKEVLNRHSDDHSKIIKPCKLFNKNECEKSGWHTAKRGEHRDLLHCCELCFYRTGIINLHRKSECDKAQKSNM